MKSLLFVAGTIVTGVEAAIVQSSVTSSSFCRNKCINQSNNFCPSNARFTKGVCCTDADACTGKVDICSNEASTYKPMQYQACPKEPWCGSYFVYPDAKETVITLQPLTENTGQFSQFKSAKTNFYDGALCTYQIVFPIEAEENDKLAITLQSSQDVSIYFIASYRYGTNQYLYKEMKKGLELSIKYPYKVYITVVSTGVDATNYG